MYILLNQKFWSNWCFKKALQVFLLHLGFENYQFSVKLMNHSNSPSLICPICKIYRAESCLKTQLTVSGWLTVSGKKKSNNLKPLPQNSLIKSHGAKSPVIVYRLKTKTAPLSSQKNVDYLNRLLRKSLNDLRIAQTYFWNSKMLPLVFLVSQSK